MELRRRWLVLGAAVAAIPALFAIERTAAGDDAAQYWLIAGRLAGSDDPFYVAAVDHKGPLWAWVYRAGYAISGDQRYFWFLMAAGVMILAVIIGSAAAAMVRRATGNAIAARVVGVTTVAFCWFGPYGQVLYGRNLTAALIAAAALAIVRALDDPSRRATALLVPSGAALGLASTTVLTAFAPSLALVAGSVAFAVDRPRAVRRAGVLLLSMASAIAAVLGWFVAQGAGGELWAYAWEYNRLYAADSTPLIGRAVDAAAQIGSYHVRNPHLLVGPVAVALVLARLVASRVGAADTVGDGSMSRTLRVQALVACWWLGEAVSLAAPNRWFEHYWILLVAPTAVLGGILMAEVRLGAVTRRRRTLTLLGALPLLMVGVITAPRVAFGTASAVAFEGPTRHEQQRWASLPVSLGALRAVTAASTEPDDEVYAWAPYAALQMIIDRPAATRFDRRTWQTGEVWGSDTVAVLPRVWEQLMSDLDADPPRLIIEMLDEPIPAWSPVAAFVAAGYREVFETGPGYARVYLRVDDAAAEPPQDLAWRADGDAECVVVLADTTADVRVIGGDREVIFTISDGEVVTGLAEPGDWSSWTALASPRSSGPLDLVVGSDWVLVRDGDHIVGAGSLSLGVDRVVVDGEPGACRAPVG